ncbi:MAG: 4Fe-4S dicluster domain-containing protein [Nitrospirae bacterium]|nr:4Fe-4S dicluster domain-containing protein [Nitrospirota bacterium]
MTWQDSKLTRRDFIKVLGAAPASLALDVAPGGRRYAKLMDTFKCIGCRRCMSACKRWNKLPPYEVPESLVRDMDGTTYTVVNFIRSKRNTEVGKFIHWACQHCIKPACAGVCPVTAIKKNHVTGAVVVDETKCIGCRYCYQACPFKVPRFDFGKRVTRKCHLCFDRIPKLKPACVAACPVEALDYGYRDLILRKARQKAQVVRGYVMGEYEAGGTDMITILPAPPEELGLIVAPKKVVNEDIDKLRISSTGFLAGAALVGLMYLYSRGDKE